VPLHTLDRNQSTTYVDRSHSELECRMDILDSIKATMDVSKTYQHLGWRLSTSRRLDPPHRLLTSHDIDSAFKAARAEQGSGRKTKQVFIEILNTVRVWMVLSSLHDMTLTCRLGKRSKHNDRRVHLLWAGI
jgi:hypothetical protein